MDFIQTLCEFRQSSTGSVVSGAGATGLQQRMHVKDDIEDWLVERVERWASGDRDSPLLIVLSGNAGDGKSDLIERLLGRLGALESCMDVIRDATHADTPSEDQLATLSTFFDRFGDDAVPNGERRVYLIAINTGMALSIFEKARAADRFRFSKLEAVLKGELGLADPPGTPPPWEFEVVNLDRRNLLSGDQGESFFERMLDKVDPEKAGGVFEAAEDGCLGCDAREWCFVRTNVELLRERQVRTEIKRLLWAATLGGQVHLSPRNLWDLIYQVTTGGIDFFEGRDSYCQRINELRPPPGGEPAPESVANAHSRLVYQLLFEPPHGGAQQRGPVLEAISRADPIRRSGRFSHQAESAAIGDPASDSTRMAEASEVGAPNGGEPDPFLVNLAELLPDAGPWPAAERDRVGRGVLRRALVMGAPSSIADELRDGELDDYLELLSAYATWVPGSPAPQPIRDFARTLTRGVRSIFGIEVGGHTYFRQDSFSPATRHPSYVEVNLEQAIRPVADPDLVRGQEWLRPLRYLPSYLALEIKSGETPWRVRADLALFRLLGKVAEGYSASSVDLETFFGLRFACERLGSANPGAAALLVRDIENGTIYRLEEYDELGTSVLAFEKVAG